MNENFLKTITADYPEYNFYPTRRFSFRFPATIHYIKDADHADLLLLHELGHALLNHKDFPTVASRVKMESEAWSKAELLAKKYGVKYDNDFVQSKLDTYRALLDQKSRCPRCSLTRYQTKDQKWHCPRCDFSD